MEKICTQCGQTKPLEDFGKDKRQRFGRRPECKSCEHRRPSYLYKSLRTRLKQSKWHSTVKNELTVEDVANMDRYCYFCRFIIEDGASIHRIDHKGDYTVSNSVMVHKTCHAKYGGHTQSKKPGNGRRHYLR